MIHTPPPSGTAADLDDRIVSFLQDHPRSQVLTIAQNVLPDLFHQHAAERAMTYAWLQTHLCFMSEDGILQQETGEMNAQVWTLPPSQGQ